MHGHCTIEAADCPAAEQLLLLGSEMRRRNARALIGSDLHDTRIDHLVGAGEERVGRMVTPSAWRPSH